MYIYRGHLLPVRVARIGDCEMCAKLLETITIWYMRNLVECICGQVFVFPSLSLSLSLLPLFPTWPSLAWASSSFSFFFVLLTCHVMRPFCGLGANSCCKFGHKNKFYLAIYFLFDPGMPGLRLCDEILTKLKGNICRYILRHAWRSSAS